MFTLQRLRRPWRTWASSLVLVPLLGAALVSCGVNFRCEAMAGPPPATTTLWTANGRVYLFSHNGLYELRTSDGKLLWQVQGNLGLRFGGFDTDQVYLSRFQDDGSWLLEARRASDGHLLWSTTQGTFLGAAAGFVYLYEPQANLLWALSALDGSVRWQTPLSFPPAGQGAQTSSFTMQVSAGVVYLASSAGSISAYRQDSGKLLWNHAFPAALASSWFVSGGVLYLSADQVYALRASDGSVLWHHSLAAALALNSDTGILYTLSYSFILSAMRVQDGQTLWAQGMPALNAPAGTPLSLTLLDGVLYAGPLTTVESLAYYQLQVLAMRASDGQIIWQFQGDAALSLAAASGTSYLLAYHLWGGYPPPAATLTARQGSDGAVRWKQSIPAGGLLITDDALYTGYGGNQQTNECYGSGPVIAAKLSPSDGRQLWRTQMPANM